MASGQTGGVEFPQGKDGNQRVAPPAARLSDEESKVLKECESESFFRRALPLSCGAIFGVQYLVRTGKMARHPRLGALPKSIIAGGLAYLLGKVSYIPECRKKILTKIPDSNIAQVMRKGQAGPQPETSMQKEMYTGEPQEPARDEFNQFRNTMPADAPSYEGLNDSQRPSLDNDVKVKEPPQEKKSTTYDDLRQKNRQDYKDSMAAPLPPKQPGTPSYKDSPFMPQKTWPDKKSSPESEPSEAPPKRKRTNMWGDTIEE